MQLRARQTQPSWIAPVADVAVLLLFVAIGRRTHNEGSGVGEFLRILWPFLVGLGLGYAVTRLWSRPLDPRRVVGAWLLTVATGEVLRLTVQDRPWRPGFLIVALLFLGAAMAAWRLVAVAVLRRTGRDRGPCADQPDVVG